MQGSPETVFLNESYSISLKLSNEIVLQVTVLVVTEKHDLDIRDYDNLFNRFIDFQLFFGFSAD